MTATLQAHTGAAFIIHNDSCGFAAMQSLVTFAPPLPSTSSTSTSTLIWSATLLEIDLLRSDLHHGRGSNLETLSSNSSCYKIGDHLSERVQNDLEYGVMAR
jgi:hypothetical protein